jgi:hypothetical protein
MARAACKDSNGLTIANCQKQNIVLFVDGRMIPGLHPVDGAPQKDWETGEGELQYKLERNVGREGIKDNDEVWANILGSPPYTSKNFFDDILTDVNGSSFHRLQMLVWTLVLGMLFVYSVWKRLSMPEFDTALLALQGITAGTYLGFKLPEKQT